MTGIKQAMAAKLKEINSDFQDSDMLVDFVLAMVENHKPKEYINTQLLDLISDTEAKIVTDWLFEYMQKPRVGMEFHLIKNQT